MNRIANEHTDWTDRLSDFMDGGLASDEHALMERHLAECGECRGVLEELRDVASRAAGLGPVEPSRDLWGGIAAAIEAPVAPTSVGAQVIELPTAGGRGRVGEGGRDHELEAALAPRRFVLSSRQLAAASVALVAATSFLTWSLLPGTPGQVAEGDPVNAGVIMAASQVPEPPADLAGELASLEAAVVEARSNLDPNTVRVLERNLGIIEQAIEDSRRALAQDPENDFLVEHLHRVYERKIEYLRDATRVAENAG